MEDSQEKDYSFLGNDTFPNLYDAIVYGRKFKSEYLEYLTSDYLRVNLACVASVSVRFGVLLARKMG